MPLHRHLDVVCAQLYKRYNAFIKVSWGTNKHQQQKENGITFSL